MRALMDGKELDLPTDQVPAFTFAVEDDELSTIRGNESAQVTILATNANRVAAGGYSTSETADRTKPFKIVNGTEALFDGVARIRRRNDEEISFYALGGNASWMPLIKDQRLRALDMGSTDTINRAYVEDTWTNTATALYFPAVDYGAWEFRAAGYDVPFTDLRPGIRVEPLLRKAFSDAGFTLGASGRFEALFPKLVLLNTNKDIPVSDFYLAQTSATFTSSGQLLTPLDNNTFVEVTFGTATSDPSGTYTGTGRYTVPLTMTQEVTLTFSASPVLLTFPGALSITVQLWDFTIGQSIEERAYTLNPFSSINDVFTFNQYGVAAGKEIGFRVRYIRLLDPGDDATLNITSASVEFSTIAVPYQSGVQLDIAGQAPDLKVSDVLKWLCNLFCLIPQTRGTAVTLSYHDDFYRPTSEGVIDLTERVTGITTTVTDSIPSAYVFKHEEDSDDRLISALRQSAGIYGSGDYQFTTGGEEDEKEITIGLAATAMATLFQTITIPALRDIEGELLIAPDPNAGFYPNRYGWEPRLCIADGLADGAWTYAGALENTYPNCYSYGNSLGGSYSTHFGGIAGSVGTVDREWLTRLARRIGPLVECNVIWHDHELSRFDPSKAVKFQDGQMTQFAYVREVEQHKFFSGEDSATTLIPI